MRGSLGSRFDGRDNSLNLLRLVLAATVLVWHSFRLSGHTVPLGLGESRLSDIGVDGFFAISGFLIVRSWDRQGSLRAFVWHRALRILPAFYVCLVVTVVVIAPLAWVHQHSGLSGYLHGDPWSYVTRNVLIYINQYAIAGGPQGVPYPHAWDGSLWTLYWELLCYLGVALLGVIGLLRRSPWVLVAAWLACWLATTFHVAATLHFDHGPVHFDTPEASRLGLMFLSGSLLYVFRDRVPVSRSLAACCLVVLAGALVTTNYRAIAAIPYAYLLLWLAIELPHGFRRIGATNDLSYGLYIYAFPIQQLLAIYGALRLGLVPYMVLSFIGTILCAAASWMLVERPALRRKSLVGGRRRADVPAAEGAAA